MTRGGRLADNADISNTQPTMNTHARFSRRVVALLANFALALVADGEAQTIPEIEGPRAAYNQALTKIRADRDKLAAPANRTYAVKLEELHKKLTDEGEAAAALAVKAEQERFAKATEPTGEERRKMTGLLLALRVAYEKERAPAYMPANKLEAQAHEAWAAGLAQLQDRFTRFNQHAKAAVVKAERDKLLAAAAAAKAAASAPILPATPAQTPLDPRLADQIKAAIAQKTPTQTETSGKRKGSSNVPEDGALLVGFELSEFSWRGKSVKSLDPIFLTREGVFRGAIRGKHSNRRTVVEAHPGYAVGGLHVYSHDRVGGLQLVFMKIDTATGKLDPQSSYTSPWYGTQGEGEPIRLGCDGKLVIGVHGASGADVDTIGLVQMP
jgi:hypothetical protein